MTSIQNPQAGRYLPDDASREDFPMYDGLFGYFPGALAEVARWSKEGGRKYNEGELKWLRDVSTNHEDKIIRHLMDADKLNSDGFYEAVALAWRALALCQTILERNGWPEGSRSVYAKGDNTDNSRGTDSGMVYICPGADSYVPEASTNERYKSQWEQATEDLLRSYNDFWSREYK